MVETQDKMVIVSHEVIKEKGNDIDRIDGFLSIGYYAFYIILLYLFGVLVFKTNIFTSFNYFENDKLNQFIFYIPITFISVIPIFILKHIRKQSFTSLGIKINNVPKSIALGVLFALPLVLPVLISGFIKGTSFTDIEDMIWTFIYFLVCIGFVEELVFRGFIQTRIRGIIKGKWMSIMIVGVMFAMIHIPFQMLRFNMSFIQFVQHDFSHLLTTMIFHIYFVYIYTRQDDIIAPTITHTLINFIPTIFIL